MDTHKADGMGTLVFDTFSSDNIKTSQFLILVVICFLKSLRIFLKLISSLKGNVVSITADFNFLLDRREIEWINNYHLQIIKKYEKKLLSEQRDWLNKICSPI